MATTNLILTHESSESEIKRYFNAVLKLSRSDNEYPVNLDEVWMLVYSQKSDAVKALQKNFIENIDYQVLRQNPQNLFGGRPSKTYLLSVPCLEFFIARKIRPVFEVYREVFHKTVKSPRLTPRISNSATSKRRIELLETQLRPIRIIEQQERELKCSCFSYLVANDLYYDWERFHSNQIKKKVLKKILSKL